MFADLRALFRLLPAPLQRHWLLLLPLLLLVALLESASMVLLYHTIAYLGQGDSVEPPAYLDVLGLAGFGDYALVLLIAFLGKNVLLVSTLARRNRVVAQSQLALADTLLDRYLHVEPVFHLGNNSATLVRNVNESVESASNLGLSSALNLVHHGLIGLAVISMLVYLSPLAGLLVIGLAGTAVAALHLGFRRRIQAHGEIYQAARQGRLQVLQEFFAAFREIVLNKRTGFWVQRVSKHQRDAVLSQSRAMTLTNSSTPVIESVLLASLVAFILVSLESAQSAALFPLIGSYAYAAVRLIPAASGIAFNTSLMQYAQPAVRDLLLHYRLDTMVPDTNGRIPVPNVIALDGVCYRYPSTDEDVLRDVSLRVNKGEVLGIAGENGSGKSTLMLLLLGLLTGYRGRVLLDGRELSTCREAWHAHLAYLPQQPVFLDDSIRANIAFADQAGVAEEPRMQEIIERVGLDALIRELPQGLDTRMHEHGARFSGGQRQRIALARALYSQPDYLFLDEANSALDSDAQQAVCDLLDRLRGEISVVLITHSTAILEHCDRVLRLRAGRLVDGEQD